MIMGDKERQDPRQGGHLKEALKTPNGTFLPKNKERNKFMVVAYGNLFYFLGCA